MAFEAITGSECTTYFFIVDRVCEFAVNDIVQIRDESSLVVGVASANTWKFLCPMTGRRGRSRPTASRRGS